MKNLIVVVVLVILTGCSASKLGLNTIRAEQEISSGRLQESLQHPDYSVQEEQIITHALNVLSNFRNTYGDYIANPEKLLLFSPEQLAADYEKLTVNYLRVRSIVEKHWDEYPNDVKHKFKSYEEIATRIDVSVNDLMQENKYRKVVRNGLVYSFTLLKLIGSLKP